MCNSITTWSGKECVGDTVSKKKANDTILNHSNTFYVSTGY
jgi:hypothetical protein